MRTGKRIVGLGGAGKAKFEKDQCSGYKRFEKSYHARVLMLRAADSRDGGIERKVTFEDCSACMGAQHKEVVAMRCEQCLELDPRYTVGGKELEGRRRLKEGRRQFLGEPTGIKLQETTASIPEGTERVDKKCQVNAEKLQQLQQSQRVPG